jgi:hypothetical protein
MNEYEAAQRIARAVSAEGWGSLSDSEINVLHMDEHLNRMFIRELAVCERQKKLGDSPGLWENIDSLCLVNWESDTEGFEAQVWYHTKTTQKVLEVKRWDKKDFHSYESEGTHSTMEQEPIKKEAPSESLETWRRLLRKYGCPEAKIREIISNIDYL